MKRRPPCQAVHEKTGLQCWQRGEHDHHPEGTHWAVQPATNGFTRTIRWNG